MIEKKQPQGIILVDDSGRTSKVIISSEIGYTGYSVGEYRTLRPGHRDYIGSFELRRAPVAVGN